MLCEQLLCCCPSRTLRWVSPCCPRASCPHPSNQHDPTEETVTKQLLGELCLGRRHTHGNTEPPHSQPAVPDRHGQVAGTQEHMCAVASLVFKNKGAPFSFSSLHGFPILQKSILGFCNLKISIVKECTELLSRALSLSSRRCRTH